ncbi:MAG: ABC transporter permease [Candidatus Eremiobacteraeota bacterium]|nr:ABC transporter permease [Candidatus Eremiobacteraeota bacterium]MBC5826312.1 ABC transporter permease [Candidatus Eremiobacteraeota bacterium]
MFRRNLLAWQKYAFSSMAINIMEPVVYFVALGFGLGSYVRLYNHGSLASFMAPGLLAVTAVNAATFDSCWGCFERLHFNGVYESMVTAPVDPLEIAGGEYLWQAFRAVLYGSAFLAVIAVFGLVHSWWALLCPLALAVTGIVFAIPGLWVAMLVKSQEHLFFYFSAVTPLVMISGVFFPLDRMPRWAVEVVWFSPLYHAVNIFRALLSGHGSVALCGDAAWLIVAIVLLAQGPRAILRAKLGN